MWFDQIDRGVMAKGHLFSKSAGPPFPYAAALCVRNTRGNPSEPKTTLLSTLQTSETSSDGAEERKKASTVVRRRKRSRGQSVDFRPAHIVTISTFRIITFKQFGKLLVIECISRLIAPLSPTRDHAEAIGTDRSVPCRNFRILIKMTKATRLRVARS